MKRSASENDEWTEWMHFSEYEKQWTNIMNKNATEHIEKQVKKESKIACRILEICVNG